METETLSRKILRYEQFLNERLRTDLRKVQQLRGKLYNDIVDYKQLQTTVDLLRNERSNKKDKPLKTMVDLGCNFYVSAKVDDCSTIFISIGLGFHLEMKLAEASAFVEEQVSWLTARAEKLSEQSAQINGRIKLVMETLKQLQFPVEEDLSHPRRELW